jgi:hypothetical protein
VTKSFWSAVATAPVATLTFGAAVRAVVARFEAKPTSVATRRDKMMVVSRSLDRITTRVLSPAAALES